MTAEPASIFHVVTVVWGPSYVDSFLNIAVPNQSTSGNLGALPRGSRYRVFTSPEDAERLAASPILGLLKELMPVDLIVVPAFSDATADPLVRATIGHRRALADAREAHAGLVFLNADFFMSEGALAAVMRRHAAGSRAVAAPGIRLDKEEFVASLEARGGVRSVASRDLASLALKHLHPFTRSHMIDAAQTACSPISVYWRVKEEGLIVRAFFLHPLMVDPVRRDVFPKGTIDARYLVGACPAREQVHIAADSDELCLFELSSVDAAVIKLRAGGISRWRAARQLSGSDSHGRFYWTAPIRIHGRDIGSEWRTVEEQSARFAKQVAPLADALLSLELVYRRAVRPLRRRAGQIGKRLRGAAKPLAPQRVRRSAAGVAEPLQKMSNRAARAYRRTLYRTRRSITLLLHSASRPVERFRKRAAKAGRRVLRRARTTP